MHLKIHPIHQQLSSFVLEEGEIDYSVAYSPLFGHASHHSKNTLILDLPVYIQRFDIFHRYVHFYNYHLMHDILLSQLLKMFPNLQKMRNPMVANWVLIRMLIVLVPENMSEF